MAAPDQEPLVDFETTALKEGVATHRMIKDQLKASGIDLVPLMLVQVDSSAGSVERVKLKLLEQGFTTDQIATHTAAEPDSNLQALAVDESKEILIFKMAVALGFDAPRAFTLVSMRGIADTDFGTQIVGRIMRVHARCQGHSLPPLLQNAYVFLADCEAQVGLSTAAQKVNKIQTELAKVSPFVVIVQVAGQNQLQIVKNGQTYLLPGEKQLPVELDVPVSHGQNLEPNQVSAARQQPAWLELLGEPINKESKGGAEKPTPDGWFKYNLREDVPHVFLTQRMKVGVDEAGMAGAIAESIQLTKELLIDGMRKVVSVIRVEQSIFILEDEKRTRIDAEMALRDAERQAQKMLFDMGTVDPKDLQQQLMLRLKKEYQALGEPIANHEDQLYDAMALILVQHPKLLRIARKSCEARYTEIVNASPLPETITSATPLDRSSRNVYRIYPADLNNWERPFAEWLDNAEDGIVLWWHRNPPSKAWSVAVTLSNGSQFFPDFLIGIQGRETPDSVLLADTKRAINDDANSLIKAVSDHKAYGKTAILFYEDGKRWKVVRYNEEKDKNEVAELFDLGNAKSF